jgi:hypothetical protein
LVWVWQNVQVLGDPFLKRLNGVREEEGEERERERERGVWGAYPDGKWVSCVESVYGLLFLQFSI